LLLLLLLNLRDMADEHDAKTTTTASTTTSEQDDLAKKKQSWAVSIASDDDDDGSDDEDDEPSSSSSSRPRTKFDADDDAYTGHTPNAASLKRKRSALQCPYLDSIDRTMLDFDFNKQCSVTLATLNVYACLVCGKYFQGRSTTSPAQLHSLQADHHVFLNLHTSRVRSRAPNRLDS